MREMGRSMSMWCGGSCDLKQGGKKLVETQSGTRAHGEVEKGGCEKWTAATRFRGGNIVYHSEATSSALRLVGIDLNFRT